MRSCPTEILKAKKKHVKTIRWLKLTLMVTLLCASASAQQKILSCAFISLDEFPQVREPEIHITLDEANSQAKSDYLDHDDGNFHPAVFTSTMVKWSGGRILLHSQHGDFWSSPLTYDLSRTSGAMTINDTHHFKCEVAQQKF
jgi:NAD-dependent oxidoreductase involved in siderophore biosynthesis